MQDINGYERFIGLLPGCYSMGVSHPETFAAGANLVLNSAEAPLTALTVYGHSTQDGTPSPDNPVPIVSAGDSGEIGVSVGGGQLLDPELYDPDKELNGITFTKQIDGTIQISGTATGVSTFYFGEYVESLKLNETYSFFGTATGMTRSIIVRENGENKYVPKFVMNENVTSVIPYIQFIEGQTINEIDKPMFVMGETPLPFQPYVTPQTLILSTPGGLPGIPVDSGGNYTDADGQQWVCDEIDLARGKYVQRVKDFIINRNTSISTSLGLYGAPEKDTILARYSNKTIKKQGAVLCRELICAYNWENEIESVFTTETGIDFRLSRKRLGLGTDTTIDENKTAVLKFLETTPLHCLVELNTPIETDLPAEEIAAYKALHTYTPTTTVSNDAAAWMKVGYYGLTTIQKLEKEAIVINGGKS